MKFRFCGFICAMTMLSSCATSISVEDISSQAQGSNVPDSATIISSAESSLEESAEETFSAFYEGLDEELCVDYYLTPTMGFSSVEKLEKWIDDFENGRPGTLYIRHFDLTNQASVWALESFGGGQKYLLTLFT
ncbi:MAG: hypothetical protein LBU86_03120, partial [Oscillospiraceae bacterium]|nr:hypothetical protein [Oscillospiraceae bacterium]